MSGHLVWLAGRGVSMSCGLCWDVPQRLEHAFHRGEIDRAELTAHICRELARAESDPAVDIGPLERMVVRLKRSNGQENSFVTTNWDGLLDRALRAHGFPAPLHLNGSVEERNILTAWDDERARERVPQARGPAAPAGRGCVRGGGTLAREPPRQGADRAVTGQARRALAGGER